MGGLFTSSHGHSTEKNQNQTRKKVNNMYIVFVLIIILTIIIDRIEHYFWAKKINDMKDRFYKKDLCQVRDDIQ